MTVGDLGIIIYTGVDGMGFVSIRVFPKVDHSANVARIVLVEVVDLNFC